MSDTFEFDDKNHAERFVGTLHDPAATTGDVLTVQADKSIAAAPGGGGAGGVQVVTVPVSSAEILDLFNTPVVLVPGVPDNVTVVTGVAMAYLAGGTPYTEPGNDIIITTAPGGTANWLFVTATGFWDQATDRLLVQGCGLAGQASLGQLSDFAGADVILTDDGPSPTLGDGTLLVTVSYFLAPTV